MEPMQFNLVPHPATPPADPEFKVWANGRACRVARRRRDDQHLVRRRRARERVRYPGAPPSPSAPTSCGKTTCFEAFLRPLGEEAYREWNFAPSGEWAAYDFTSATRTAWREAEAADPYIRMEDNLTWWALGATIAVAADTNWELGLSAVLEEKDGTKSYWALAHRRRQARFPRPRLLRRAPSLSSRHDPVRYRPAARRPRASPPARRQARRAARPSRVGHAGPDAQPRRPRRRRAQYLRRVRPAAWRSRRPAGQYDGVAGLHRSDLPAFRSSASTARSAVRPASRWARSTPS